MTPEPRSTFDVVVIGGGPAGAVTAQQLALRGRRVALVEGPSHAPVLGDHLPAEGRVLLVRVGVWSRFLATDPLPSLGVRSRWGAEETVDRPALCQPGGAGWHLNRDAFDALLRRVAGEAGVSCISGGRALAASGFPGDWHIRLGGPRGHHELRARWLVDATGRSCWLSRQLGERPLVLDVMHGFAQLWRHAPLAPYALVEARQEGWWYSVALPGETGVSIFMTDVENGGARSWNDWWHDTLTSERFRGGIPVGRCFSRRATSQWMLPPSNAGWTAVGDAALARDPLSSSGLLSALASAPACAASVHRALDGEADALERYTATLHAQAAEYVSTRTMVYGREGRFVDAPFWRRRRASHPV